MHRMPVSRIPRGRVPMWQTQERRSLTFKLRRGLPACHLCNLRSSNQISPTLTDDECPMMLPKSAKDAEKA